MPNIIDDLKKFIHIFTPQGQLETLVELPLEALKTIYTCNPTSTSAIFAIQIETLRLKNPTITPNELLDILNKQFES